MKHILITGATGGLGGALTEQCLAHEHHVTGLHGTSRTSTHMNSHLTLHSVDFLDLQATTEMAKTLAQQPCDAFVHLAAFPLELAPFSKQPWNLFESQWRIMLQSAVILTQALLSGMRQRRNGHIIYCLSAATLAAAPKGMSAYTSAKYALLGLARSVAAECKDTGILVTCISPGPMNTRLLRNLPEVAKSQLREHAANHEFLDPTLVAKSILRLLENPDPSLHDTNLPLLNMTDMP